jgi:uncharacterized protein (UPF0276 family)
MAGLGYRRDMADWDMSAVRADFFEVVPENWVHRNRDPLHRLIQSGRPVQLHGVSLNLGGTSDIQPTFLRDVRELMDDLGTKHYSDHLAASGDAHQLHDLFPIPFTVAEMRRVSDRIRYVQDILGCRIGIENSTWYTNIGDMPEADFLSAVAERADCNILLDINNIAVNYKNHHKNQKVHDIAEFIARVDRSRISYMHVAGHEFDDRFGMYIDTHSQAVEAGTLQAALQLNRQHGIPILLEWDNDVPDMETINRELACLSFMTM